MNYIAYPVPSTAIDRLKRRARWVEGGVETDMRISEYGSYWRVHRESIEDSKVFSGRTFDLSRYFVPSDAWKRLLTVQPTPSLPWRSPIGPTLQAITSEPERIVIPHYPPSGGRNWNVFSDRPAGDGFFIPSSAPYRIYERYAVLDPTVVPLRRSSSQFMGVGRFGFPAFTAWADVRVGNVLSPWAAGHGYYVYRSRFWMPHDPTPIINVRQAAQASKSLRDKILLRIGPRPRFVAGGSPILADIDTVIVGRP